ncbi:MAG TPA: non-canonical purine NTP pyrophosphatase, RdgB/HAM1 family [Gammaproteobacteria bacterium]|jgi:XTP/dITP diphosphohydrolase|nr:RdgB/HAM1 family non-canonical purine NTP pyrophosphatase [Pseudomonadota bacterium]HAY45570.1 non-canonical purine NTP pyrophosphatase, RdgB/HAM1 family [Gammaproteobacteria bacterium]
MLNNPEPKKKKLVLATGNAGKVQEMDSVLADLGFEVISQRDLNVEDAIEDGLSFVENSLIKSRHASRITGLPAVADDSGISVDALNGAPGIYSARYAGDSCDDQANNDLLLENMRNVAETDRGTQFVCVLSYVRHAEDPMPLIAQGVWHGSLLFEERGTEGFGYDPLFWVPTHKLASAELEPNVKRQISHRAKALELLCQQLTK